MTTDTATTPRTIEAAGTLLYGAQWQREMARALGVSDRLVRMWVKGERKMSDDHWRRIGQIMEDRAAAITHARVSWRI